MKRDSTTDRDRVRSKLYSIVYRYAKDRVGVDFRMNDLDSFASFELVGSYTYGSAGRILRDMRQRGIVSYVVVDRSRSLYRIDALQLDEEEEARIEKEKKIRESQSATEPPSYFGRRLENDRFFDVI